MSSIIFGLLIIYVMPMTVMGSSRLRPVIFSSIIFGLLIIYVMPMTVMGSSRLRPVIFFSLVLIMCRFLHSVSFLQGLVFRAFIRLIRPVLCLEVLPIGLGHEVLQVVVGIPLIVSVQHVPKWIIELAFWQCSVHRLPHGGNILAVNVDASHTLTAAAVQP